MATSLYAPLVYVLQEEACLKIRFICNCWSISFLLVVLDPGPHSQDGSRSRSRRAKSMRIHNTALNNVVRKNVFFVIQALRECVVVGHYSWCGPEGPCPPPSWAASRNCPISVAQHLASCRGIRQIVATLQTVLLFLNICQDKITYFILQIDICRKAKGLKQF